MTELNLTIKQEAGVIACDLTAVREYLNEQLEIYRNMVFTEDSKKDAKATAAELRKEKKNLQDNIKTAKAEYMKPWEAFNEEATEIVNLFDEPIDAINEQVTAFEEKRKAEKKAKIQEAYDEIIAPCEYAEQLILLRIWNDKWLNATVTINQVKSEMCEIKANTKTAVEAIKSLKSEAEDKALVNYFHTFDLPSSIAIITRYEADKREILAREQERQRREEEERIRREERAKVEAEQAQAIAVEVAKEEARQEIIDDFVPSDFMGDESEYTYSIKLTAEAKVKLEMFMDSIGIEYEELPPM